MSFKYYRNNGQITLHVRGDVCGQVIDEIKDNKFDRLWLQAGNYEEVGEFILKNG